MYFLFKVQTHQVKAHNSLILKICFISSIYEDVTPSDKVFNEKSKFPSEILTILISKVQNRYRIIGYSAYMLLKQ